MRRLFFVMASLGLALGSSLIFSGCSDEPDPNDALPEYENASKGYELKKICNTEFIWNENTSWELEDYFFIKLPSFDWDNLYFPEKHPYVRGLVSMTKERFKGRDYLRLWFEDKRTEMLVRPGNQTLYGVNPEDGREFVIYDFNQPMTDGSKFRYTLYSVDDSLNVNGLRHFEETIVYDPEKLSIKEPDLIFYPEKPEWPIFYVLRDEKNMVDYWMPRLYTANGFVIIRYLGLFAGKGVMVYVYDDDFYNCREGYYPGMYFSQKIVDSSGNAINRLRVYIGYNVK